MDTYLGSTGKRMYTHYDDEKALESNGRQKKRPNPEQSPQSDDVEYRILCPSSKIGSLIGKGGASIKALRQDCKSKIKVEDPVEGSDERVIYICSTRENRIPGTQSLCPAQEALFRVFARIVEADVGASDDDEPPPPVMARLLVPHSQIGCLLGKGGKIIEQMRREIPCQIRVMPKDQLPACASSDDELVQLSGDPILVKKALNAVSSRLFGNTPREQGGSFMPPAPNSNMLAMTGGGGLYPTGSYLSQGLTPTLGGSVMGLGGYSLSSLGGYGGAGLGNAWSLGSGLVPPVLGTAGIGSNQMEGGTEEELVLRILCPNDRIGSVIGKGGNVIRKMREESGAKIQIGDPIADSDERVIEITSTEVMESFRSPGIDAALQVHRRLVELQTEKDKDSNSFTARLLVPAINIGCVLGKGGNIISEMRKTTRANIRVPPKDELPKCANDNDELVQIMGDQAVVYDALNQVLNRLRMNIFKGHEGASMLPLSSVGYGGSNPYLSSYGGRYDTASAGGMYPLTNVGLGMDYSGYGSGTGVQASSGRGTKDSKRRR